MKMWGITNTGLVRSENQDAYAVFEAGAFHAAVVCDGMGGTNGGQVASAIAVARFEKELRDSLRDDMDIPQLRQAMLSAIACANDAIRQEAARNAEYQHMGTTLVCAVTRSDMAIIGNIGDSRAYHITPEGIFQISRDHSVVENMVAKGDLTPLEARTHPNRNLITRALGPDAQVQADSFSVPWRQGDFILLCTDGLVNTVSALYPTTTDKNTTECRRQDGSQGWVNYDGYSDIAFRPGIWYVMPVTRADHMQFVGGIANKSIVQTHLFYLDLMDDIYSTYRAVQPGETPFPFTDVPESRWSYPYIKQLYDAGVVSGMTATTFAPAENMTRAQFVTMLAGLQGADVSAYRTGKFTDVPADAWYAPYVSWAAENGVVYGVSDTAFAPGADISRQDMAVMVYRYAECFGIRLGTDVPPVTFADTGDIAAYALPAVQALQRAGVISGMPDGSFRPREHMTREQACVVLSAL